jgi:carbamoyl-phosphate synthase large subunit
MVIGVTSLNANDNPGSGVAVIRSLREAFGRDDLRIVGLAYESLEPGIYLPEWVDITYRLPFPTEGTAALTERLKYIHDKEKLDLVIPNFDSELFNFIKIAPWLQSAGIKTFLPTLEQLAMREKVNLADFGKDYGFRVPADHKILNPGDLKKASEKLGFPMVVKGKYYEASVDYTAELAERSFYRLSARWGLPVIAQQFVKGTEINVAGLGDGKGNAISVVPMRKLYITDKGKGWAGITIEDDKLISLAKEFIRATNWRGGFELEIMRDNKGDLYIMEINPRFPAWLYLATAAGQNQPAALVKMAMGETVEAFGQYEVGKMFVRYSIDHMVNIADFQQFSAFDELSQQIKGIS